MTAMTPFLPTPRGPGAPPSSCRAAARFALASLLLLAAAPAPRAAEVVSPAGAAPPGAPALPAASTPPAGQALPPLGAGLRLGSYFNGLGARSRVVQVCIVAMALALFILMRKLAPSGG